MSRYLWLSAIYAIICTGIVMFPVNYGDAIGMPWSIIILILLAPYLILGSLELPDYLIYLLFFIMQFIFAFIALIFFRMFVVVWKNKPP